MAIVMLRPAVRKASIDSTCSMSLLYIVMTTLNIVADFLIHVFLAGGFMSDGDASPPILTDKPP